jgi:hypothetical protein
MRVEEVRNEKKEYEAVRSERVKRKWYQRARRVVKSWVRLRMGA